MKNLTKPKPFHVDKRGSITQLLNRSVKIKSALLITCKKNEIRANHYHKKDEHYVYLLKGQMKYYYKDVNNNLSKTKSIIINKGEIIRTPAMEAHSMKFLKNSIFLALSTEPRNQQKYEKDTVKIKLI